MKNHARSGTKKGSLGYRTPSSFRFTAHQKARDQQIKNKFTKKGGEEHRP